MELRDYLEIVRRRWLSATVVALLILASVLAGTLLMTPEYTATTRLFFAVEGTGSVTELAQGSTFAEKQMTSYAQVATSPLVLDPVIESLGLGTTAEQLTPSVTPIVPADTVILEISVTRPDPAQATAIANAVATELARVAGELTPSRENGSQAVKATILARAIQPLLPSSPNIPRNLAVGLVLGIIGGLGVALLRNVLDTKVRDEHAIRAITDSPLLGAIAFDDSVPDHPVVVAERPLSAPAEAVRRLRTNLQFIGTGTGSKTVVITSSIPGEGKSTTSINLAASLADAGSRVLLVDADLRRPSVAGYLGLEGKAGLTSVLIGRADLADVIQPWGTSGLHVLPSGQIPPNPSELLGSPAMSAALEELSLSYDVILLDTPPLLPVTDATVLTKMVGGAVVVIGADRIHKGQLAESMATLETAGAHVHGLVLNKVARRDAAGYGYGYGGYYTPHTEPVADIDAQAELQADQPAVAAESAESAKASEPVAPTATSNDSRRVGSGGRNRR